MFSYRLAYGNNPFTPAAKYAAKKTFLKKGIGTQQVVTILQNLYPYARIERADLDTSANKKMLQHLSVMPILIQLELVGQREIPWEKLMEKLKLALLAKPVLMLQPLGASMM